MSVHLSSFVTYTFSKFPYEKFTLKVEHKWKGLLETRAVAKLDLVYIWIFLHRLQPRTQSVRFSETALRAVLSFGIHVWILLPLSLSPAPSLSLSLSILFHFLRFLFWLSFSVFLGDRMRKECRKLESKIFSWKRYFLARKRETKIFSWKFWSKLGQNPR